MLNGTAEFCDAGKPNETLNRLDELGTSSFVFDGAKAVSALVARKTGPSVRTNAETWELHSRANSEEIVLHWYI